MRPSPLAASLLVLPVALLAQKQPVHPAAHAATHVTPARSPENPAGVPGGRSRSAGVEAASLPVTRVALYKNGVGFFEHTGRVAGDAAVTIDLTSGQLNDVLQSLTAIDLNGGRIFCAGYNSTTPLDQQLKTLPLSLDDNPTASDFYSAIRGARVEVRSGSASPGVPGGRSLSAGVVITGRLLSVEVRSSKSSDDSSTTSNQIDRYFLTVVSDLGDTRTIEITGTTSVRLLDASLHNDVSRYLQLIDANRSQGLRHLTLSDNGAGTRELRVSYISEVPIWKSTYRILFSNSGTASEKATLQGWSVVDNTTGADWNNVQLSLIAGAPQSFIQPLSQPVYSRRPEVAIAQEAQLSPQTHDSGLDKESDRLDSFSKLTNAPASVSQTVEVDSARRAVMKSELSGRYAGVAGMSGAGVGYGYGGAIAGPVPAAQPTYEESASASVAPDTHTANFDDFFEYRINQPITIRKNESALVPILQAKVSADPVTLVSYNTGRTSQPLRALWVTNNSGLTLDRGSFTIIEDGNFAGEGLLDPVHPDEKRLLSYAADQAVHVAVEDEKTTNRVTLLRGSHGVLNIHREDLHQVTLVLHNAAPARRTVISEVPVINGWKLDSVENSSSTDPKPIETTATVYRFRNEIAPADTARLHIGATHSGYATYYLTRADDNQLQFFLNTSDHNPALVAALQPILDARAKVGSAQAAVDQTKSKLDSLRSDEERQRANIVALKDADKSSRDRFVAELNKTEDAINSAQAEFSTRTAALDTAKAELASAIDNFSIDTRSKS